MIIDKGLLGLLLPPYTHAQCSARVLCCLQMSFPSWACTQASPQSCQEPPALTVRVTPACLRSCSRATPPHTHYLVHPHTCARRQTHIHAGMGVVTKVGSGVTAFKKGQRVTSLGWMGHEGNGSWQQYINVPAERVVALPDGISDEAGAQFYVGGAAAAAGLMVCWCHPCLQAEAWTARRQHGMTHGLQTHIAS